MAVQISSNKRVSSGSNTVVYKLTDDKGSTVRMFEVPITSADDFQKTIASEKTRLEQSLNITLTLVKVERVF